jgi:flavin-dependent dehydrogenase
VSNVPERACDVLIIGAGMAGACLARQLRLEQPDLRIIVIDKKVEFDWWVGESTTEPFYHYAFEVLKLGPYMMKNHVPKHGLRFFFDSKDKDLSMSQMSEWGRAPYDGRLTSWQLDRAAFDRDLAEINRKSGVEVLLGTSASSIEIDRENGHRVETSAGPIRCRYLVDAGGRSSPLAMKMGLVPDTHGPTGSVWARYDGCKDLDELGDDRWKRRVELTRRFNSTNHFMYDGYWIWHIPVSERIISIGVAFDRRIAPLELKNVEDLTAFFRTHRWFREIAGHAKPLDFMALKHLGRLATRFYSEDRWYLTGMSGSFVDPLLSTSGNTFAACNRFIAEIIRADREGDQKKLNNRIRHGNLMMTGRTRFFNSLMNYHRFGCYDSFAAWLTGVYMTVWNYEFANHFENFRGMLHAIDKHEDTCGCEQRPPDIAQFMALGNRLCDEFIGFLDPRGLYHAQNRDRYVEISERLQLRHNSFDWSLRDRRTEQDKESNITYEAAVRYYLARMCEIEGVRFDEASFNTFFTRDWRSGQKLMDGLAAMRAAKGTSEPSKTRWVTKGPVDEELAAMLPWFYRFSEPIR